MKKILKTLALTIGLHLLCGMAYAVNAPTGLTSTAGWVSGSVDLRWNYDSQPSQWYIWINGSLNSSPTRSQVGLTGTAYFTFNAVNVPSSALPATITMQALANGVVSSMSSPILVTGTTSSGGGMVTITGTVTVSGSNLTVTANQGGNWSTSVSNLTVSPIPIFGSITNTVKMIPMGSDGGVAVYTTVPASALPATPRYLNQSGPAYEFGACTTCTAGARFFAFVRPNTSYITLVDCTVTYTTGVQGVSMCFLTPSARTRTTIYNPANSGKVIRFLEWFQQTPPAFPADSLQEITPGAGVTLEDSLPYLHIFSPGGSPSVAPSVLHVTDTKWAGNYYP